MTDKSPNAALIVIGNEILSGRTQDKNINYIATSLSSIGVRFLEVRVIPDIEIEIINTVNDLRKKYSYVFTSGGIGPTHDDITTEAIAKAFHKEIIQNKEALRRLSEFYKGVLNEGRLKMTYLPVGAELIDNPVSVAPGFKIENVYVMAGIPNVMQAMFDSIKHTLKGGKIILSEEVRMYGSESKMAIELGNLQKKYPDVEIGSYPFVQDNKFGVSLVLRGIEDKKLDSVKKELLGILIKIEGIEIISGT